MHENSMKLMKEFVDSFVATNDTVLDIGSGDINGTYRSLFPTQKYVGVDITQGKNVDILIGSNEWDKLSNADVIVSGQTIENVENITQWLTSLFKVLKEDGLICMIAPSAGPEHYMPVWNGNFSLGKMERIMKETGFEVISCETSEVEPWKDTKCVAKKPQVEKIKEVILTQKGNRFNEAK